MATEVLRLKPEPDKGIDGILPQVIETVERIGKRHRWSDDLVHRVSLILDEITTNIVSYGRHAPDRVPNIEIGIESHRREIAIEVCDNGRAFDPTTDAPAPPDMNEELSEVPIGGLGLHLVRSLTSAMAYQRANGQNRLTLRTQVPGC